ncbi:MAG: hypothetical protein Q4C58_15495 [Eubacteriales bacterium]|nr:hypothetical protein [Eubacteriales bacterium]
MYFLTIKARKESDSQYAIVLGGVMKKEDEKYEAFFTLIDKKKPRAKYGASEIKITSGDKETLQDQIKQLAEVFPPVKKDVNILDLTAFSGGGKHE